MFASRRISFLVGLLALILTRSALAAPDAKRSPKFAGDRREAPNRQYDFIHLRFEGAFDWRNGSVAGSVTHRLSPLASGSREVRLDSVDIDIRSVERAGGGALSFRVEDDAVWVDLGRELARGEELEFTLHYTCRPKKGVYFFQPTDESPEIPMQMWTQGESIEARHWIPCFDHPSDKLTTEMILTVPAGLTALSNGRLLETRSTDETATFHWLQEKPHTTYLIAIVAGKFAKWEAEAEGIQFAGYADERFAPYLERAFKLTPEMMRFYNKAFGVPYPWARYDQACVVGFPYGGMENTTLTTLTEWTLYDERAALDASSYDLVAHELVHQWFGNLVTCKDWGEIWINESFATFFSNYFEEHHFGWDEAVYSRNRHKRSYLNEDKQRYRRRLATPAYSSPSDVFDAHSYPKGARILNMLRYVLGDEKFLAGIRLYLERNAFRAVESADFRVAMEEATGESLRWFFEQWIHAGGHPVYRVRTAWDRDSRTVAVTVSQQQKVDDLTPLFSMPVGIEVTTPGGGKKLHKVRVSAAEETFTFPAAERPLLVRFDPGDWILKEMDLDKSREELMYQLTRDSDVMGRHAAAEALKAFVEHESVRDTLLERVQSEPFWGVRAAIVRSLAATEIAADRDLAVEQLLEQFARESKSAVRREIVSAVAQLAKDKQAAFLRRTLAEDPSYAVVIAALRALETALGVDGVRSDAERALEMDSQHEKIRRAALDVLGRVAAALPTDEREPVLRTIAAWAEAGQPSPARSSAFAALARAGKDVDWVYGLLTAGTSAGWRSVRTAAVRALGNLGDPRAIEFLESLRGKNVVTERLGRDSALEVAIKKLTSEVPADERNEELRRRIEKLEAELETLGERLDALDRDGE